MDHLEDTQSCVFSLFSLHLLEITTHAGFSISVLLFGAFVTKDMSIKHDQGVSILFSLQAFCCRDHRVSIIILDSVPL
ncbi:hypothetical protein L207DRAFT_200625 [Hyaloscypha variabilis F]|uniref:Uncharacterized protein n=1 Tax=Hyaloscypha variabilis (strain UAMH 11265 / GT02V1 / F) TaxID=1149755 RepID=A0A2J6QX11_HYAVF|nr:hypothetical protein L207DRAFT_200625 [Hyaloscypha variabilis F]